MERFFQASLPQKGNCSQRRRAGSIKQLVNHTQIWVEVVMFARGRVEPIN